MDVKSFLAGHKLIIGNKFSKQSLPKSWSLTTEEK